MEQRACTAIRHLIRLWASHFISLYVLPTFFTSSVTVRRQLCLGQPFPLSLGIPIERLFDMIAIFSQCMCTNPVPHCYVWSDNLIYQYYIILIASVFRHVCQHVFSTVISYGLRSKYKYPFSFIYVITIVKLSKTNINNSYIVEVK